jgi:hypothetical protein
MHDEQRWPDCERSLRRFGAASAGSQVKTHAKWLRSRAQQGRRCDAGHCLTGAE